MTSTSTSTSTIERIDLLLHLNFVTSCFPLPSPIFVDPRSRPPGTDFNFFFQFQVASVMAFCRGRTKKKELEAIMFNVHSCTVTEFVSEASINLLPHRTDQKTLNKLLSQREFCGRQSYKQSRLINYDASLALNSIVAL